MATYHLHYFRDTFSLGSEDIEAAGDAEAFGIARDKGNGRLVEVWNAHSRLRIVSSIPPRSDQPGRFAPVHMTAHAEA